MSLSLLKIHKVCERTALARSTVYSKIAEKKSLDILFSPMLVFF